MLGMETRAAVGAFPWEKVVELAGEPFATWVRKDGTPFDLTYPLKAWGMIELKSAAALFEGMPVSLAPILDEADTVGGRPKGFPLKSTAEIAVATKVRRFSSPDVIGVIEGSDQKLKDDYVALMGHADHIGIKAGGTGDRINNGALDNGAGVATLIEVARAFTTAAERPRRSILVVANTGEEKGLLGAEYFAHYPTVPIDQGAQSRPAHQSLNPAGLHRDTWTNTFSARCSWPMTSNRFRAWGFPWGESMRMRLFAEMCVTPDGPPWIISISPVLKPDRRVDVVGAVGGIGGFFLPLLGTVPPSRSTGEWRHATPVRGRHCSESLHGPRLRPAG